MSTSRLHSLLILTLLTLTQCSDGAINIFTLEDDKQLGLQSKQQIESNPQQFPIVPRSANPKAYAYLDGLRDQILATGTVKHKNDFLWELHIVKRDDVVNAFCTPGGYIYVYTGLIKYLDNASSLAGVMGHEMAHADRRHSTDALTQQYGISTLLQVVLGNDPGTLANMAASLVSLKFSRAHETEADEYSVKYLCNTKFQENGAANFFIKMLADTNSSQPPQFLSTHPSHENRVKDITATAAKANCAKDNKLSTSSDLDEYKNLKLSL